MPGTPTQPGGADRPTDGLRAEARRHAAPVLWLAAALEVVAAAATIAKFVPAPVASALLVGVPLASLALVSRRQARRLESLLRHSYDFDRRYERVVSRWTFCPSDDPDYWDATHHGEREMVVLQPIGTWTWSSVRRSDDDVPRGAPPPSLRNAVATRSGVGECVFHAPHKQKTTVAFRIEFEPRLRVGERVSISFDLDVPQHKGATLERLRRRPAPSVPPPGESEFSSTDISYPIDHFVHEVIIPESLEAGRFVCQVIRRDNEFVEEAAYVNEHGLFDVSRVSVGGEPAWRLRIERRAPPIRTTYRLCWRPPDRSSEAG